MDDGVRCFKCKGSGTVLKKIRKKQRIDPEYHRKIDNIDHNIGKNTTKTEEHVPFEKESTHRKTPDIKTTIETTHSNQKNIIKSPCTVCDGSGRIIAGKKVKHQEIEGTITRPKRPIGWVAPGPRPLDVEGVEVPAGEALCYLTGDWRIYQPIGGHRYSTDDVVTAWYAVKEVRRLLSLPSSEPQGNNMGSPTLRGLDLGSGLGSVLMMVLWQLPTISYIGVEAQEQSVMRARRSAKVNNCTSRCEFRWGDLRNIQQHVPEGREFNLVTGTPPYFPLYGGQSGFTSHQDTIDNTVHITATNTATATWTVQSDLASFALPTNNNNVLSDNDRSLTVSSNTNTGVVTVTNDERGAPALPAATCQRPCNWEYRGGIEEYCRAAWHCVKPGGIFIVCEAAGPGFIERVENAARNAGGEGEREDAPNGVGKGFVIVKRLDVVPKIGVKSLFSVYTMIRAEEKDRAKGEERVNGDRTSSYVVEEMVVRNENGKRSDQYVDMLNDMGMPP